MARGRQLTNQDFWMAIIIHEILHDNRLPAAVAEEVRQDLEAIDVSIPVLADRLALLAVYVPDRVREYIDSLLNEDRVKLMEWMRDHGTAAMKELYLDWWTAKQRTSHA